MGKHGVSRERIMIYTLHMEEFAIGRSSVPYARDMMFNYDQGKLHKLKGNCSTNQGFIFTQVARYVERETVNCSMCLCT